MLAAAPRVIVLDPGHGGKDPGAVNRSSREKDLTLGISKKIGRAIAQQFASKIYYTRLKDRFISLGQRNQVANRHSCDFFLSVHVNAAKNKKAQGVELYYLNNASDSAAARLASRENQYLGRPLSDMEAILSGLMQTAVTEESREAAGCLQRKLKARLGKRFNKPIRIKTALFYVLVGSKCPGILLETGFMSHPKEGKQLRQQAYQQQLARAVAEGLGLYFQTLDHPQSDL